MIPHLYGRILPKPPKTIILTISQNLYERKILKSQFVDSLNAKNYKKSHNLLDKLQQNDKDYFQLLNNKKSPKK